MITLFITLFLVSLLGIVYMIGRKLVLVRNGQIILRDHEDAFVPDVHKIRNFASMSMRQALYISTFLVLKLYVKTLNLFKKGYDLLKSLILYIIKTSHEKGIVSKRETNKVLKAIADYKKKISIMKNRIHEGENN